MGQVVLLVGEPGLGKSRVVYTLKEHVLGQMVEGEVDAPVIEWRCSPHYQNSGLYPAIDFYERALAFGREEPPSARFDRLLRRLEQYELDRPETVPLWAALLSLPTTERFPSPSLPPARQREETFRAMLEWLHTRAARKPILFVVEDLHWADASTLEFLGQFLAEGQHDSILTLLTFRPEFKTPWPAVTHQTSLALNRLTRRQVGDLMRAKTGASLPESVVEQVYDRAGGVPLFVEEFTKMLQESVVLDQAGQGDAGSKAWLRREIPATLQDLVMARLDRMEGERDVAQLAATLGREFSYELLAAVASMDEPTLQVELAKLVQAEILYTKGRLPRCTLHLQARAGGRRLVQRADEGQAAAVPRADRRGTRSAVPADHRNAAGTARPPLHRGGPDRNRDRLLAQGRPALAGTIGGERSDRPPDPGAGAARDARRVTRAGRPRIGTVGRAGHRLHRVTRLCRAGGRPGFPTGARALRTDRAFTADSSRPSSASGSGISSAARSGSVRNWSPRRWKLPGSCDDPGGMMEAFYIAGQTMLYRADFAGARDQLRDGARRVRRPRAHQVLGSPRRATTPASTSAAIWRCPSGTSATPTRH